jgi:uncharacterized protein YjbI with pentapeptide repeats
MSQTNIIRVPDADNLFIHLAAQRKKLTPQAVVFCRERLAVGMPASVTAARERFLGEEDVAAVYRQIQEEFLFCTHCQGFVHNLENAAACPVCQTSLPSKASTACVVAQAVEEDEWESSFIAEVKKRVLFDDKAWQFFLREQKRLAKMGHEVRLSTLICHHLEMSDIVSVYQIIAGDAKVLAVKKEVVFSDLAVPTLRSIKSSTKKKSKKRATPESQMNDDLGNALSSLRKGKGATKKQAMRKRLNEKAPRARVEEEDEDVQEEDLADILMQAHKQREGNDMQTNEAGSMARVLQELSKNLMQIAMQTSQVQDEGDGEDRETRQLKRGKKVVSEEEIKKIFTEGGELDNAYIASLNLASIAVPYKVSLTNCVFDNVEFKEVNFENNIDFEGSTFIGKARFHGSTFGKQTLFKNVVFVDGADFAKVKFCGETHFNSANFKRFATFNHAEFQDKTIFTRAYFAKGVKFADVTFAQGASFNDIGCDHRFYMEKCSFQEETTFSNSRFAEVSDFSRSKFTKSVKFKGANFAKLVIFQNAEFAEEADFSGMAAEGDVSFERASFAGTIQLRTLCAERNLNFLGAHIGDNASFCVRDAYFGRLFITRKQIAGHLESHIQKDYPTAQKEYGLLKNNFRGINEYEQEDWAYLMEKRMERLSIRVRGVGSAVKRLFNWLALDVSCGYGTRPFNIFASSMGVLLLFAVFYFVFGSSQFESKSALSFLDYILISFRTFANASVGGAEPISDSWINYVMMMESFLGLFVITILAVTFSRKVIR